MLTCQSMFNDFLFNQVMSLEPSADKKLVEFIDELVKCLDAFEFIFESKYSKQHSFGLNNVRCFISDKRALLDKLRLAKCEESEETLDDNRINDNDRLIPFNLVFVTGGMCVGKTTVIGKLMRDPEINPRGSRAHAVIEPTEYWYQNKARQLDDTLRYFVFKNNNDDDDHEKSSPSGPGVEFFPFSEFFITTWMLNIMINMCEASRERKTLLLIERDFSDEYLLQRRPCQLFADSFKCFECMKHRLGAYVLVRVHTKRPLAEVMRLNLAQRRTSELGILENKTYREFVDQYEADFRALDIRKSLLLSSADSSSCVPPGVHHHHPVVRDYFVDRFVSEYFDDIKWLILSSIK